MKCKHCDGDGVIVDVEYGHAGKYGCKYCDGKGVVEPLTNEEWLKSANTEQLAEMLFNFAFMCSYCGDEAHSTKEKTQQCHFGKCCCQRKDWEMWLKQPHTNE